MKIGDMATGQKAKLDMKHGFIQSIIKNQVDRNNYDKEVKAARSGSDRSANSLTGNNRTRKPDAQMYIPPRSRQGKDEQSELFCLEYEDQYEVVHKFIIYKDDSPLSISEKIGQECQLSGPLLEVLTDKVHREMEKRLKTTEIAQNCQHCYRDETP